MESESLEQRWQVLLQELHPEVPPPDMTLYVKPRQSCADSVVSDLLADASSNPKVLLIGAKGGGKSTELRAISHELRKRKAAVIVEVDLDRSGVQASSLAAYDLLYICSLALLKHLPEGEAKELFEQLSIRYSGGESKAREGLGSLGEALAGVAGFAEVAAAAASATGLDGGGAVIIGKVLAMATQGLRLLPQPSGMVSETSPRGRSLQEIAAKIAEAVVAKENLPICMLLDGLEKMNGEAGERFKQVFEHTRLLADARWASVIAAPPCTLTETSSVEGRGFSTTTVWGFGPDDLGSLVQLLEVRFRAAGFEPTQDGTAEGFRRMAEVSGGLPRHAVMMARKAVLLAAKAGASSLKPDHIEAGIRTVAEFLGRGLNEEHLNLLARVARTGKLPGDEKAATLFADGRILAYPPQPPSVRPHFAVHPLLLADIEASS
jgi:hypothetical protein